MKTMLHILVYASDIKKVQQTFGTFSMTTPLPWVGQDEAHYVPYALTFEGEMEEITREQAEQLRQNGQAYAFSFVAQGPKAPSMGIAVGRSPNARTHIDSGLVFVFPEQGAVGANASTYYVRDAWTPLQEVPLTLNYYSVNGILIKAS